MSVATWHPQGAPLHFATGIDKDRVEDFSRAQRPSIFPRVAAALVVVALIGSVALVSIGIVAELGPMIAHGSNVEHEAGTIVAIGPGKDFVLLTSDGQRLSFLCAAQCRASLGHMQRHMRERAHTDVYYLPGPDRSLMALDVD
jgi:hypothetical protein